MTERRHCKKCDTATGDDGDGLCPGIPVEGEADAAELVEWRERFGHLADGTPDGVACLLTDTLRAVLATLRGKERTGAAAERERLRGLCEPPNLRAVADSIAGTSAWGRKHADGRRHLAAELEKP